MKDKIIEIVRLSRQRMEGGDDMSEKQAKSRRQAADKIGQDLSDAFNDILPHALKEGVGFIRIEPHEKGITVEPVKMSEMTQIVSELVVSAHKQTKSLITDSV